MACMVQSRFGTGIMFTAGHTCLGTAPYEKYSCTVKADAFTKSQ